MFRCDWWLSENLFREFLIFKEQQSQFLPLRGVRPKGPEQFGT